MSVELATTTPPHFSAVRAFVALVSFSFRRQWRVRQMGGAALGLLALLATTVAVITYGPVGWSLPNRKARIADRMTDGSVLMTHRQYSEERLIIYQGLPGPADQFGMKAALFAPFHAIVADEKVQVDWSFLSFSRWVVFVMFLGFLLPLFVLAYASAGIGTEREARTLIWLLSRPLPRWAVYLAKFFGGLPWCLLASLGGLTVLGLAGGELGWRAVQVYWPAAAGGAVAFAALFHLIGAVFRRPAVVGLVYIFFFETLVANLPGSLKQLSLNYYVRSLMYNEATSEVHSAVPSNLDVYAPATPTTAWVTLALATIGLTLLGMVLFGRQEPAEEV